MKKLYPLLSVLFLISYLDGQDWLRTYGGDEQDIGWCVQETNDGGFVIVGQESSFGNGGRDVYIIKTNINGDTLWTKSYGYPSDDGGNYIEQTTDNGYIITGGSFELGVGGGDNVYLIKTDVSGDSIWTKRFNDFNPSGSQVGRSVQQTTDGGYIVTGDGFLMLKTDSLGNEEWRQTNVFGYDGSIDGDHIEETSDGGYIIISNILIKLDSLGFTEWINEDMGGNNVQQTSDGGYVVIGQFTDNFQRDYISIIKSDSNGQMMWYNYFGGDDDCTNSSCYVGYNVEETSDGGYMVFGKTYHPGGGILLIKTDSSGIQEWEEFYNPYDGTYLNLNSFDGKLTTDGSYVITGYIWGSNINDNVFLLKTNPLLKIESSITPVQFQLNQLYPNPFNPSTTLEFSIPFSDNVNIRVLDITGREVDILMNKYLTNGNHRIEWNGQKHPSGVYFISFQSGGFVQTRKVVLMK